MTVVGDLAQCSTGEPGTWRDHLPATVNQFAYRELTINYRSPSEINDVAGAVLADLAPSLDASTSIRSTGFPPRVVAVDDLAAGIAEILAGLKPSSPAQSGDELRTAVISVDPESFEVPVSDHDARSQARVRWLSPWNAKGLEFDHVILVEPAAFLLQPRGLSLLYVALTRSTDRLTIVHRQPLPQVLAEALGGAE